MVLFFSTFFSTDFFYTKIGDDMRIKIFIYLVIAVVAGYVVGLYLFRYQDTKYVSSNMVYFIQDTVALNPSEIGSDYTRVIQEKDGKYYSYVGITMSHENALKVQEYYSFLGVDTYIQEEMVSNLDFIGSLQEYDQLLSNTSGKDMLSVLKVILATYDEMVLQE